MATRAEPPVAVVIALGSNLGDRARALGRAVHQVSRVVTLVKVSGFVETAAVDAPSGSPPFLNAALVGHTRISPLELLRELQAIEGRLGRRRPAERNAPRNVDLDLIFYGGTRIRTPELTLPHPRWREREFVLAPLRALRLPWLMLPG